MTNEPTITQVMKNTCMRISDESLKNCQFVSMTSLMLLSNSIEMRECRPIPGGDGHCLDIGESLGIWKGWRLHSTACTCSHVQSGRCSPAKHGGAYFSAIYGFMKDPIAAPGPYENQEV